MDQKLIEVMKVRRIARGLSIRALAEQVGVSFSALARLERGIGSPDSNTKARIINWLGEEAMDLGFDVEPVADVHFRASKNVPSMTIEYLVVVASVLRSKRR
jgi:transcriptional regulator with XRE-family HTH domain